MSILGLVVEYNPFHLGHLYHLQQAQRKIRPTATIAVMSGSFTQRGQPAIVDKWARAQMALAAGVDLVLELPTAWATQSAPNFAAGSVQLLAAAGATDICFGSELGQTSQLEKIAALLLAEPPAYRQALSQALKQGHSFAAAQGMAITETLPSINTQLFKQPNNTLAVMYLLAIIKHQLPLKAHTIKRIGAYHSINPATPLPSATALRQQLLANEVVTAMPPTAKGILQQRIESGQGPVGWQDLAPYLFYHLRCQSREEMNHWPEASEGLGERLWLAARRTNDWDELIRQVKTRRFPLTRIQRLATYILLNLGQARLQKINVDLPPPYLRVLALNTASEEIRRLLKTSRLPVIYGAATAPTAAARLHHCLELDIQATDIYTLAWQKGSQSGLDFTHPLVTR